MRPQRAIVDLRLQPERIAAIVGVRQSATAVIEACRRVTSVVPAVTRLPTTST
jgi:hypothetical protein